MAISTKKTTERLPRETTFQKLKPHHREHFIDEGWTDSEIEQAIAWGVRSVAKDEAAKLLGYMPPSGGIWFPFSDDWGQLRPDVRQYANGDESPKYCSPKTPVTSAALWLPPGAKLKDLAAITEGWKDAFVATMRGGKPVGAIAGVSHVAKALPPGAGIPLLFDADGWWNANVMGALIAGGKHLKGKIALIPEQYGDKGGTTEFFTGGGDRAAFAELLDNAQSPAALLCEWMARLVDSPLRLPKHCDDLQALYRKVWKLGKMARVPRKMILDWQSSHTKAWRRAFEAQLRAQQVLSLEHAPVGEFEPLVLPPSGQRRLFAVNGQKGVGKTSIALKGLVDAAKAANLSVLCYVPTQMLSRDAARVLGLTCHLDKDAAAQSRYVMSCGESAHLFRDRRWDLVIIDEANEVLPRSWQGTLGQNPKAVRSALANQISSARIVAIAQDGLYRPVLNAVQRIGGFSADQAEIISRRRAPSAATIHLYEGNEGYYGWTDTLLNSVSNEQRVSIPSGSEEQLTLLQWWAKRRVPKHRFAKLTGKSKSAGSQRTNFAKGPDAWIGANAPAVLGFSPVFNSGVSIEQPYFDSQFEYVAALETATSASQRGERVRAAIGGIPRHVFIQRRGLPELPSLEVFSREYWRSVLTAEDEHQQPNLAALGMGDVATMLERDKNPAEEFPELAEVLAIQAREIHFKKECLEAEWRFNGWTVAPGAVPGEATCKALAGERRAIREAMLESKSRALSFCPSIEVGKRDRTESWGKYQVKQEAENPVDFARFTRWGMEGILGNLPHLARSEFWAAYHLDSVGEISAAQVNALLRLQFSQPEVWANVTRNAALKVIGSQAVRAAAAAQVASGHHYGGGELPTVPDLAASPRLLTTAALLGKCPGIREVMAGELTQWNKNTEVVQKAHRWAIANATQLAALSKHSQRWFGLQFTDATYGVQAFHKLLKMAGLDAERDGQRDRVWQYRLKRVADVDRKIEQALASGKNTARLLRERYRTEHQEAVITGALNQALSVHTGAAQQWVELEAFTREHFGLCTELQKEESNTTEVLCSPSEPPEISPSDWLDMAEMLRKARLVGGAAVEDLRQAFLPLIGGDAWRRLVQDF